MMRALPSMPPGVVPESTAAYQVQVSSPVRSKKTLTSWATPRESYIVIEVSASAASDRSVSSGSVSDSPSIGTPLPTRVASGVSAAPVSSVQTPSLERLAESRISVVASWGRSLLSSIWMSPSWPVSWPSTAW